MSKKVLSAMLLACVLMLPTVAKAQTPGKLSPVSPLKGIVGDKSRVDIGRHPLTGNALMAQLQKEEQQEERRQPATAKHSPRKEETLTATIPYSQNFDTKTSINEMYVIDSDGDGTTWAQDGPSTYATVKNGRAKYSVPWNAAADFQANDWLLTPYLPFEVNKVYTLTYHVGNVSRNQLETYAAAWGTGDDPSTFTELVPPTDLVYLTNNDTTVTLELHPAATGQYRIGFHALSKKNYYNGLWVDNISVTVAEMTSPDSVTSLSLTPDPTGIHKATISFTAPVTDVAGNSLSSLDKIDVYRDDSVLVKSLTPVAPGEAYSVVDSGMTDAVHKYDVVPANADGEGTHAVINSFVGTDRPAYVNNITLKDNYNNTATMSWDEPHTGFYGYFVNPDSMRYIVFQTSGGRPSTIEDDNFDGLSYTFNGIDTLNTGEQGFLYYGVAAKNRRNSEDSSIPYLWALSNFILTGTPMTTPFQESFKGAKASDNFIWTSRSGNYGWQMTSRMSYDNDGGSLSFYSPYDPEEKATLGTGKISMAGMVNPKLVFRYYNVPDSDMTITVLVNAGTQYTDTVSTIKFKTSTLGEGWQTEAVSLDAYKSLPYIWVQFDAQENSLAMPILLDDIEVYDVPENDLEVKAIYENAKVNMGGTARVAARIENRSGNTSAQAKARFYLGGKLVGEKDVEPISAYAYKYYTIEYPTKPTDPDVLNFKVVVSMDNDLNDDNNSDSVEIALKRPVYTTVDDLTATASANGVDLSWTAPSDLNNVVTDGFEDYDAFIIDGIGNWETYDGDGGMTNYIYYISSYDNMGQPFAYQVFNPVQAGVDLTNTAGGWDALAPHDGDQYLISSQPYDYDHFEGIPKDDWLISPELDGRAQTISFWCRSLLSSQAPEKFQVLYSNGGTTTSEFQEIYTDSVQAAWTEFTAQLPEGAKHFAIRCISENKYWFMLDDISYVAGDLTVNGYNIYRDGELIGTVGATVTSYTDSDAADGDHTYYVTVVYAQGESDLSNPATPTATGISSINSGTLYVGSADGAIIVRNANAPVFVYSIGGEQVANVSAANASIPAKRGAYLVKVGGKTFKLTVK